MLTQPRPIRLKGRSYLALTLTPELPFEDWLARLDDLASRSAGFFLRRPVVLDITGLDIDRAQLRTFVSQLGSRQVRIMGIEGASPSLLGSDLPPAMADGRPTSDFEPPAAATEAATAEVAVAEPVMPDLPKAVPSIIVTQPVRSGQSLVFLDMPTLQQPEAYLAQVHNMLDENGGLKSDTAKFLAGFLEKFAGFAAKNI